MREYALIVARLCLAIVFLYSGVEKLWYYESSLKEVRGYGLPFPHLGVALTVAAQLLGGVLVVSGYLVWFGALILAGFTILATLIGHRFWRLQGEPFRHELTTTLEHLAIVGGLLLIGLLDFAATRHW
jgi:uncharacterized membrane protein YphA (DoxX/SURF4 family)